ncbi:MAG: M1 family aminopeptidase [Calditrichia bacterium]
MEYPTLFTVGTHYGMPEGIRLPELVIIHEFGHNYWQGMVASNEFEESWLDEGINTYTELQIMNHLYGPRSNFVDYLDVQISDEHFSRLQFLLVPDNDPIVKNSWQYASGGSYTINSYQKRGCIFSHYITCSAKTLCGTFCEPILSAEIPASEIAGFVDIANEISGKNLQPFFDQALHHPDNGLQHRADIHPATPQQHGF